MSVAVFVANEADAACLIPWGVHFACAEHAELLIVCPRKSKGKRGWDPLEVSEKDDNALFKTVFEILSHQDHEKVVLKQDIAAGIEPSDLNRIAIETRELIAPNPEEAFVEEIKDLGVGTLLVPAQEPIKSGSQEEMAWAHRLFTSAPCQVAMVRGAPPECEPMKILVAARDDATADDTMAVLQASKLSKVNEGGSVTLLYVRPDDDWVAQQVAEKHLKQIERNASLKPSDHDRRIVLADSFVEGINQVDLDQFDLVIVGTRKQKEIRSIFRDIGKTEEGPKVALAIVRGAVPLTDRVWSGFKDWVRSKVPQLDRDHRVTLVDRLQDNSEFNFDFVALISLSTLIAALGLARDSGAVVIGAMLVAPLMTPLVGMGFALVQGNEKLIRDALKSVILGFTVALAIGAILGLFLRIFAPDLEVTQQMIYRDKPNVLDLIVALASGVAGAYAMGRPNLLSALPGVAIAAALVPPIATSGLALTMGDLSLSGGASLLFFTNIVAIVLGTAMTFWAVGVSTRVGSDGRAVQVWPRYWFLAFVVISFVLAIVVTYLNPIGSDSATSKPQNNSSNIEALTDIK